MKKIILLISVLNFFGFKMLSQVTAKDCTVAVNVCTNASFSVSPAGGGFVDFTTGNTISNPVGNPPGVIPATGMGCLKAGELNPTWMIINIQTAGTLEFSMGAGTGAGAQSGCYDWIMWPYNPTTCAGINANTTAPVRCCWNSLCSGGTGLASPANLPATGNQKDFGAPLNVNCGDKFIMCFSNYSGVTTLVPLNFFGTAIVSCSPITNTLSINSASMCPSGVVTLSVAPSPGTTYTWMPGGSTSSSITVSPPTTTIYTLTATNSCGTLTGTTSVYVSPNMSLNLSSTNGNCALGTSGSASVTASGGTPAYTYSWSPSGGTGSTASNLSTGNYTVKVTDALGCTASSATNIIAPLPLTFSVNSTSNSYTLFCNPATLTLNAVNTSTLTNVTYTWTPGNIVGNPLIVTTPGIYFVSGQDQTVGSCVVTQTISISQNTTTPVVNVNPTTANITCNGAPASFTATCLPFSLNNWGIWLAPGTGSVGALSNSPLLGSFTSPGTYTAMFTDITTGCVGTNTVTVTANNTIPTMTVNALNGYTITCLQPCLVMNITSSSTLAPKGYTWTNMATSASVTPANGGYTICVPGNYTAQFHDGNFCYVSQMITVSIDTVRPSPSCITGLASNGFTLNCYNSCITPTAISNPLLPISSYSWTTPPNLTVASNTVPICLANITSSTTPTNFTVLAQGANGCVGRAKIPFYKDIFVPLYTAVFTPSAITCANLCVAMSPQTTFTTPTSFTFTSPPPTTTATTAGAQFCVPGPYTMHYQNQLNGCSANAYTTIPVNATPPATIALSQATIPCGSNTVGLTAGTTSNLTTYQYNWVGPIGAGMTAPNGYSNNVNSAGYYLVTITNTVNGCRSTNEVNVVNGGLNVSFTPDPQNGFAPLSVGFTNGTLLGGGSGTVFTTWSYGNGVANSYTNNLGGSGSPNGSTTYPTAGNYTVVLAVTVSVTVAGNTTGCYGTATTVIHVDLPSNMSVPNVFTPNGDGVNDVFFLQTTNLTEITCVIFDRWGVKMYDVNSDKGNIGWDGKTLFGKEAPSGTYFYIIKATGKDNQAFEQKGSVGLYR